MADGKAKNTRQPPVHIPLDFERAIEGLLAIDATTLPKTAADARKADKKRAATKASARKRPAK